MPKATAAISALKGSRSPSPMSPASTLGRELAPKESLGWPQEIMEGAFF